MAHELANNNGHIFWYGGVDICVIRNSDADDCFSGVDRISGTRDGKMWNFVVKQW